MFGLAQPCLWSSAALVRWKAAVAAFPIERELSDRFFQFAFGAACFDRGALNRSTQETAVSPLADQCAPPPLPPLTRRGMVRPRVAQLHSTRPEECRPLTARIPGSSSGIKAG